MSHEIDTYIENVSTVSWACTRSCHNINILNGLDRWPTNVDKTLGCTCIYRYTCISEADSTYYNWLYNTNGVQLQYIACAMLITHLPRWGLLAPLAPSSSCLIFLTSSSDSDCSLFLRSRACFCSSYSLRASVSERITSRRFLSNFCLSSISSRLASCSESWSSFWRRSRIDCSSWRDDCLANRPSSSSWRLRLVTLHKST